MCGRYTGTKDPSELEVFIALDACTYDFYPRYNIAPTQIAPVIARNSDRTVLQGMRWGLIPSWSEDDKIGHNLINARIETAAEKPAFREAWKHRRCLVPADGFYEWQSKNGSKQPSYFHLKGRQQFCFAGMWESWLKPADKQGDLFGSVGVDDTLLETFTILTTRPNTLLAELHDRMPVMLKPENAGDWLRGEEVSGLGEPFPSVDMVRVPVSGRVNNPRYDTQDCLVSLD